MDFTSKDKQQDKNHLSELVRNIEKNSTSNSNGNKGRKEYFLDVANDYSELRQSYNNTMLKNISINFGFPNTINTYKYKNYYPLTEIPMFEQKNIFYYDKDFRLFKNKSVSKYGEKKNKDQNDISVNNQNNRIMSPQHKIITSIRKKKYEYDNIIKNFSNFKKTEKNEKGEKNEKAEKNDKDIYELEVINQVLYDDEEGNEKNKKNSEIEYENEWGEIEQEVFEKEEDKKNNLLNSIYVEIEKENGEKQVKVLEISKEEKDPRLKVRYSVEDKMCLQAPNKAQNEEQISNFDKETIKDYVYRSNNYKSISNSTSNFYSTINSVKRNENELQENPSEILLKKSKSQQNLFAPSELPASTSTNKFQKNSNKRDFYLSKEKDNKIDSIKLGMHKFEKEEISPIKERQISNEEVKEKNTKLIDIIKDEQEIEIKNRSIDMKDKNFITEKENKEKTEEIIEKEDNINDKKIKDDKEDFISYEQKKYKNKQKIFLWKTKK